LVNLSETSKVLILLNARLGDSTHSKPKSVVQIDPPSGKASSQQDENKNAPILEEDQQKQVVKKEYKV
jgi:hypothetical protein